MYKWAKLDVRSTNRYLATPIQSSFTWILSQEYCFHSLAIQQVQVHQLSTSLLRVVTATTIFKEMQLKADILLSTLTYLHDRTLLLGPIIGTTYGSIYRQSPVKSPDIKTL